MSDPPAAYSAINFYLNTMAIKLPEFWADNTMVWFAQTEAQFVFWGITPSLTKLYYCVGTLNLSDTAQIVDLIEFPHEESPHESFKECLTELYTLNLFQRYQALMSLTLAAEEKPSTLMSKMCSLVPLDHRVHKSERFIFKGFFLDHLPLNICTHLMREDIKDPRKLAAKADKIWQSASDCSVNVVSAVSHTGHVLDEAAPNTL